MIGKLFSTWKVPPVKMKTTMVILLTFFFTTSLFWDSYREPGSYAAYACTVIFDNQHVS